MYNKIYNPKTLKYVNINSKAGYNIINNYINNYLYQLGGHYGKCKFSKITNRCRQTADENDNEMCYFHQLTGYCRSRKKVVEIDDNERQIDDVEIDDSDRKIDKMKRYYEHPIFSQVKNIHDIIPLKKILKWDAKDINTPEKKIMIKGYLYDIYDSYGLGTEIIRYLDNKNLKTFIYG